MPDQQTNSGTPGGAPAPAINPAPPPPELNTPSNYVRTRAAQMAEKMNNPAPGEQPPAADVQPPRQQPQPPAKIKIGDAEYSSEELSAAIARDAEARVRRSEMPPTADAYEARNSETFKLPEGVGAFQFDQADPALAAAKKFALDNGLTQSQFSSLLDIYVASQVNQQMGQVRAREANLAQLGAAGPQRIGAISTWLKSVAGKDGAAVADFITQFPSAPIVRTLETVIKRFSSQGGATFSQQHRETADAEPGKIPGYDQMSFAQKRAYQMNQQFNRPPSTPRRG